MTADRKIYTFAEWADDRTGWDTETGAPGIISFGEAVQIWAVMQDRARITVAEAAATFNVDARRVAEAVHAHPWMFLMGPNGIIGQEDEHTGVQPPLPKGLDYATLLIEHEGE